MEKRVLCSELRKIFRKLGFIVKGNVYLMDFPEMTIKVYLTSQFTNMRLEYNVSFHQLHGKFDLQGDEYKNGQLWDFCVIPRLNSEALFECKVVSNLLELNEFELEEKVIDMLNTYVYPLKDDYIKFFNKGIKWHNITKNPYAPFPTYIEKYYFLPEAETFLLSKGLIVK